jgi:hypothetical protein
MSILLILFSLLTINSSDIHKHNVSITNAKLNDSNNKIEITIELIAHDVEYYFETKKDINLKLASKNEYIKSDSLLTVYINRNLKFYINENLIKLDFLGKEVNNDESLLLYFDNDIPENFTDMRVINSILTSVFSNQQNILHLQGQMSESYTFNINNKSHKFYIK